VNVDIAVDERRLWQSHMDMGQVGALPHGGCCRTALSAADKAGRDLFVRWCREAGCEVSWDIVGNIFARRPGSDPKRAAVGTGSHLDTQPHGGKFDGIYGVLAGLEVVRALNDARVETAAPIDVVVWTNEEGVRFGPPLGGSSVFAGTVDVASFHAARTARRSGRTSRPPAISAASGPVNASSTASWRPTSSRGPSSRPKARPSASSRASRDSAG
jgi:N-carbamoyl-L-amino-acid hydrolase